MPAKASAKGRKIGRNAKRCQQYRAEDRRRKNKILRLQRHLRQHNGSKKKGTRFLRHANDKTAHAALKGLS